MIVGIEQKKALLKKKRSMNLKTIFKKQQPKLEKYILIQYKKNFF